MRWLRFPRILGLVVCLYLVGMSAVFGILSGQNYRFMHGAGRTEGTVIALVARAPVGSTRDPRAGARAVSLAPEVSYTVEGHAYTYTAAHGRFHQRLRVGEKVSVLYDLTDPAEARLAGEGRLLVPAITLGFVVAAALVAAILFRTRSVSAAPVRPRAPRRLDEPA